jgi:hypothetical protein
MRYVMKSGILACIFMMATWIPTYAENGPMARYCDLSIRVLNNVVPLGSQPTFVIRIVNRSEAIVKVADLEKRKDLADSLLDIRVKDAAGDIPFRIAISDPGPIMEEDYVVILPHDELSFLVESYQRRYSFEHVGAYEVAGSLKNYPGETLTSKPESFWVVK